MDKEKTKKEKVINWLKNPSNLLLILVLIIAISVRLNYFFVTMDQPVWWDEGEYLLKANSIAFGTPETGWTSNVRLPGFPFIAAAVFKMGLSETHLRFLMILISVSSIFLIYLVGQKLFDKRVGLIASFIMTFFYLDLFYTTRLLVDVPQIFFIMLAAYFFVEGHFNKKRKLIWMVLPAIFLGTLIRPTTGLFAILLVIFLFAVYGFKLFKQKDWYISTLLGIVAFTPYMVYSFIRTGNPIHAIYYVFFLDPAWEGSAETTSQIFFNYINNFPNYMHPILLVFLVIGLFFLISRLIFSAGYFSKWKKSQISLFIFLWIAVPFIYLALIHIHFEDRYIFIIFPAIFYVTASGLLTTTDYIFKKYKGYLSFILIAAILFFATYNMWSNADMLIKDRVSTYTGLKYAGEWIKDNSNPGDSVVCAGVPQVTYYSQRATYGFPVTEEEFDTFIEEERPKYLVLTMWERSPDWSFTWPERNQDRVVPVQSYSRQGSVSTVVYQFTYE